MKGKAPSTNLHIPKKLQAPKSKLAAGVLVFEIWSFFGAWSLEFGVL
jgi:hypothetical protein